MKAWNNSSSFALLLGIHEGHPGGEQIAGGKSAKAIHLSKDGYLLAIQYKNQDLAGPQDP